MMRVFLLLTIVLSASCNIEQHIAPKKSLYPDIKLVSIESGWKRTEITLKGGISGTTWTKENIECADHNGDGMIDYLRLQEPHNSYNHYVWIDSNRDGFFDTIIGLYKNDKNIHIPVPKLVDE